VKLFRQGDIFDREDLEKYTTKKGVEYLYLRHASTTEFIEKYQLELQALLNSNKAGVNMLLEKSIELHETATALISAVGFTPEVQILAKTQVSMTIKAVRKHRGLSELYSQLQKFKGEYLHTHSTMCSYIACSLASKLEWASDSTYLKLSLAAFLHDVTLQKSDLAKLRSLDELEATDIRFTPQEVQAFKNHPQQAAEMLKQMSQVPPDIDLIIMQHHEWPDGSGFPKKLNSTNLHPLSCVFIVAHDVVDQMLKGLCRPQDYVEKNQEKLSGSQFKKVLKAMTQLQS
jgi:HD-GYP domain-containing protein (c-di-GMP phosphodiesterase class II)